MQNPTGFTSYDIMPHYQNIIIILMILTFTLPEEGRCLLNKQVLLLRLLGNPSVFFWNLCARLFNVTPDVWYAVSSSSSWYSFYKSWIILNTPNLLT